MSNFLDEVRPSKISEKTAKKYINYGLFAIVYTVVICLITAWAASDWISLIVGISTALLGFGVYKRNLHCAIILFVYYLSNLITNVYLYYKISKNFGGIPKYIDFLVVACLLLAIIGIFKIKTEKADKNKILKISYKTAIEIVILIVAFITINFTIYSIHKYDLFFDSKDIQTNIEKTVVKIFYPYSDEPLSLESKGVWSSGIVIDPSGMIITNTHIFSKDKQEYVTINKEFFVILTDPKTGASQDIYIATPYFFADLSGEYDLVISQINREYIDEKGISYGLYPKIFSGVLGNENYIEGLYECAQEDLQIGDEVLVLEYQSSDENKKIKITRGIIDDFTENKGVITSAKLDKANSGGLAITSRQCFLGMHSSYFSEKNNNAGYIISTSSIIDYFNKDTELKKNLISK